MNKKSLVRRIGFVMVTAVALSACQAPRATYTPYPTTGKSAIDYNRDIADCRSWASSQSGANPQRALNEGLQKGLFGAGAGALLGAIFGGRRGAWQGAAAGGLLGAGVGGMQGSQQAQSTYDMAYRDCLNKKGY